MTMKLWELAGAEDDRLFSPYCWRTRMALAHKGLQAQTVPWRFTEKERLPALAKGLVPVLQEGDTTIADSWQIAAYLDDAHADRPSLFAGQQAKSLAFFVKNWTERGIHLPLMRVVLMDLYGNLHEKDKPYFRESREKRFGMTLEAFAGDAKASLAALRAALDPARPVLASQPYICGSEPAYGDYILFGAFQWARVMSPVALLAADDPLHAWRERMLDLFDGLARRAKGYPVGS